jgi:hypothetical protein
MNGHVDILSPPDIQEAQDYVQNLTDERQDEESTNCTAHRKATIFTIRQGVQTTIKLGELQRKMENMPDLIVKRLEESGCVGKKRSKTMPYIAAGGVWTVLYALGEFVRGFLCKPGQNP